MNSAPNPLWQKNPALAWREIDGESVIISPGESVMHELNDTGSFVWKHLDGQHSVSQIAAMLSSEYDVTSDVALTDTEALLQQLAALKLIVPGGPAGPAADAGAANR
jgi:hypothetical protein